METSQTYKHMVGRHVHYVLDAESYAKDLNTSSLGECRSAIIVRAWSETTVQLQVLTDGYNDGKQYAAGLIWRTSVHRDEEQHAPGTWHWPEREDQP